MSVGRKISQTLDQNPQIWQRCIACIAIMLAFTSSANAGKERFHFVESHLGTYAKIVLYANDRASAKSAAKRAFANIDQLSRVCSAYDDESELRRLMREDSIAFEHPAPISQSMNDLLHIALMAHRRTGGAFDITIGPATRLGKRSSHIGQSLTYDDLRNSAALVGVENIQLNANSDGQPTVYLAKRDMRIDVDGIAKGFIADRALATLRGLGHPRALVDIGGDIAIGDSPSRAAGWKIVVRPDGIATEVGHRELTLENCGVATSGYGSDTRDASRFIDPRGVLVPKDKWAATVVAENCALADAYATAAVVVGPALAERFDESVTFFVVPVATGAAARGDNSKE